MCFGPTSSNRFLYKDLVTKHFEDVEKVEQVQIPYLIFAYKVYSKKSIENYRKL